jgi:hypothetical protein
VRHTPRVPAWLRFSDTHTFPGHTHSESSSSHTCTHLCGIIQSPHPPTTHTHTHTLPCGAHTDAFSNCWSPTPRHFHAHLPLLHIFTIWVSHIFLPKESYAHVPGHLRTHPSLVTHPCAFCLQAPGSPLYTHILTVTHPCYDVTVAHLHVSHPVTVSLESHPHPFLVTSPHQLLLVPPCPAHACVTHLGPLSPIHRASPFGIPHTPLCLSHTPSQSCVTLSLPQPP